MLRVTESLLDNRTRQISLWGKVKRLKLNYVWGLVSLGWTEKERGNWGL